jgi:hypothetical protein
MAAYRDQQEDPHAPAGDQQALPVEVDCSWLAQTAPRVFTATSLAGNRLLPDATFRQPETHGHHVAFDHQCFCTVLNCVEPCQRRTVSSPVGKRCIAGGIMSSALTLRSMKQRNRREPDFPGI